MESKKDFEKFLNKFEIITAKFKNEAKKFDEGKIMVDLLVPEFLEAVAKIMTMGAKKYGSDNWKKNLKQNRILAALYRHVLAWHKGEKYDEESGLNHMGHVACNAMFLYWYDDVKEEKKE